MGIEYQVTIPIWLQVPAEIRRRIIEEFNLPRTGATHVMMGAMSGNEVLTDGYTHEDLLNLSVVRMQEFLNSETKDVFQLFEELVNSYEKDILTEEAMATEPEELVAAIPEPAPKRRGRPPRV